MNQARISVEINSGLKRRLNVSLPVEQVEQAQKERIRSLARTAKLPGFRPGKVPSSVIEKLHGDAVFAEVVDQLIRKSLSNALKQEGLEPVGLPSIESLTAERGLPLEYVAVFEVFPKTQLQNLETITLERWNVAIQDADVDRILEKLAMQRASWNDVQRPAQWNDRVTLGALSDPVDEREPWTVVLTEKEEPDGLAELLGKKVGDTVVLTFPDEEVTALVKAIAEPELPKIDDAFAAGFGIPEGTIEALRREIRDRYLKNEADRVVRRNLKKQLLEQLLQKHPSVEVPKVLLEQELEYMEKQFREANKQSGEDEIPEPTRQDMQAEASKHVATRLLVGEFIKMHQLEPDEARVRQEIADLADLFEGEYKPIVDKISQSPDLLQMIRARILEEQVIDKLLEQVQFVEKTLSYDEMLVASSGELS